MVLSLVLGTAYLNDFSLGNTLQEPSGTQNDKAVPVVPRGKKLILKDGTFQVIREYERNGDRVRYYSLERGAWEELPSSMVDWDATEKAAGEEQKSEAAELEKLHKQQEARRMDNASEVDASLKVGDGVFLPDGEGMFVVEGKSVRVLDQVASHLKADKLRLLEQIIAPVPVIPGKQNLVLPGTHAALRIRSKAPEFYLREAQVDSGRITAIQNSKPIGDAGPEVELVRAKVTKSGRQLESISTMFGESVSKNRNSFSIQRWEVAPSLYRFTLSEPLPPGEYILAQVVEQGLDMFVWEFGVDEPSEGVKK
jgi:hypothetical protein